MRSTTPGLTERSPPPAMSVAGSPGRRKKMKNRKDNAPNTVGTSAKTRRSR
jgi:hypothetical protein